MRIFKNSLAVLISAGIMLSGTGFAAAEPDSSGSFGSSDLLNAGTGSAQTVVSLGSQIVSSGSAAASDASNLVAHLIEGGGSVASSGSSAISSLIDLLVSGIKSTTTLSAELPGYL